MLLRCCYAFRAAWADRARSKMEEDPTPIPSMGTRKSLIMDAKGVITGEEVEEDLGHTESGCDVFAAFLWVECSQLDVFGCLPLLLA